AFVFVTGPSLYMLSIGWEGLQQYIQEFLPRSLGVGAQHDEAWAQSWTVFYWANWLAWAPITALFLGRIARGYTVRQFILVNLIAPSLFALVWMSIFGGAALHIDTNGGGVLSAALKANGAESIAYDVLAQYPLSSLLMVSFILLSFISYVTAADSNTSAIASVCLKDANATELKNKDPEREGRTNTRLKVLIAIFIGAAAWVMTAFSGIDGVKMMSNLGGLPALVLVLLMNVALILLGTRYLGRLNDT
ncbi:MAG: BCCT family transporter, partial [Kordiimonadaceae bacterium]|nr:BCCT family transporter [Kordiimonadaceae bacterium]